MVYRLPLSDQTDTMGGMEHHHYEDHRGWKVCITPDGSPDRPWFIGHAVRATRLHDVVMTQAPSEAAALEDLHRQVDAIEDPAGDGAIARRGPAC
jgi:hypothetical protein